MKIHTSYAAESSPPEIDMDTLTKRSFCRGFSYMRQTDGIDLIYLLNKCACMLFKSPWFILGQKEIVDTLLALLFCYDFVYFLSLFHLRVFLLKSNWQ